MQPNLNDKIALAKASGYSDLEIQSYLQGAGYQPPAPSGQLRVSSPYMAPTETTQPKQKVRSRGGPLTAYISEAGGAGGAAAGAAYGAAAGSIIPGAGTLIGAIIGGGIGGLIGGFGGKAVEQKIRDDQNLLGTGGSFKQAVEEGAISGAFGAAGPAFSGLRAAKYAGIPFKEAIKMSPKSLQIAKEVTKETARALSGAERALSKAYGTSINAKVGSVMLDAQDSKILTNYVKKVAGNSLNIEDISAKMGNHIDDLGAQIRDKVLEKNAPITAKEAKLWAKEAADSIKNVAGSPNVAQYIKDIAKKRSVADMQALTQSIGAAENWTKFFSSSASTPGDAQALANIYGVLRPKINALVPGLDALNESFSIANKAYPFIKNTVTKGALQAPITGATLGNVGLKGKAAVGVKIGAAKIRQAVGQGLNLGGGVGNLPQQLKLQTIGGINKLMSGGQQAQPTTLEDTMTQLGLGSAGFGLPTTTPTTTTTTSQNPFTPDVLLAAIASDPKNASLYQSLYKVYADKYKSTAGTGANVTKVTSQQYGLAQSGLQSLGALADLISQNPNVVRQTATPGRQLPIIGGYIAEKAGVGEYDALGFNVADALLRLRTGAQANESEIRNVQSKLMPRAGDSEATIRRKLKTLYDAFSAVTAQAGTQSSGTTLEDLLMQQTGGAQ